MANPEEMDISFDSVSTVHTEARCPYCDREETFQHRSVAMAWIVGHIQKEHEHRLPAYGNDD